MRRLFALALAIALAFSLGLASLAGTASAQLEQLDPDSGSGGSGGGTATQSASLIDEAAQGLRNNPVYVHPDAEESISDADAQALNDRIDRLGAGPLYIAIVPRRIVDEAGGSVEQALAQVANRVRQTGVYAIVAGNSFRAGASSRAGFEPGAVPRMADDAVELQGDAGVNAILASFVDRVAEARQNGGSAPSDRGPGGGGFGGLGILAFALGGFGLFAFAKSRRRKREERAQVEELRENVRDDLVALGDDVRALDLDVQMPNVDPRAQEHLGQALQRYEQANRALDQTRHPDDFAEIGEALEQGRYNLAAARAYVEGKAPPEHRPPCFFDPRHGPSTRDVEWAPDGYGQPRPIPVCEADAVRLESGQEPMTREVMVGGQSMPYYNAPHYFSPYAGGMFGGFTGFFPGLLFGSMLGGMFSPGIGDAYAGGFGDGGGDFGGGGFGGGDFGGFGGGDFGGGDFGGGDF